jgi:hypothetical protein
MLALALLTLAAGTGRAAPTAAQKCAAAKLKAAAAKVLGKAKCQRTALVTSAAVDGACLATVEQKFLAAHAKTEAAGGCTVTGDASAAEAVVDGCLVAFVGAIAGDARCAAAKMMAVGKKTRAKAKCHRKAVRAGTAVDSGCLLAAEAKFAAAVAKADAFATCTDTATALEALVDACVASLVGDDGGECALTEGTTPTGTVHPNGCAVLSRDTSGCDAARAAAGLGGYWLRFSCRVTLTPTVGGVSAQADGQPDYRSNYFPTGDACYEAYTGGIQNPNLIAAQQYTLTFPASPDTTPQSMMGTAVVGLALNGVPIFGNFAAPGDDIFAEAQTFDRCGAHPQNTGKYHYHSEPYAISYDDWSFIGVMRDGYPIYGRKDPDGSLPTLDAYGGHTGVTVDSPSTAVYHYHVNEQTSTNPGTLGQKQWFLTTGTFRGTPGACTGCN